MILVSLSSAEDALTSDLFLAHKVLKICHSAFFGDTRYTACICNITQFLRFFLQHYFGDSAASESDVHGKGADIALLDSAYILSEVISSFGFGVIVELTKTTGAYIACSFFCGLASCFLVLQIKYM